MSNYFLNENNLTNRRIFPFIDIGEYILREQDENDISSFFEYYTDPIVNKYILCPPIKDLEEARKELYYWRNLFYNNHGIYFAIADKKNNKMIGSIGFNNYRPNHQRIELSYDLAFNYWRKGIISNAINNLVKYIFKNWKINRIEAFVATENIASIKLLQKCKFTNEGTLRQHRIHNNRMIDVCVFSLIKMDLG